MLSERPLSTAGKQALKICVSREFSGLLHLEVTSVSRNSSFIIQVFGNRSSS